MLARRGLCGALLATAAVPLLPTLEAGTALGQAAFDPTLEQVGDLSPNQEGLADFSHAWVFSGSELQLVAASPDIPYGIAEEYSSVLFRSSADIDRWFLDHPTTRSIFINWFNTNISKLPQWSKLIVDDPSVYKNFSVFWDQFLSDKPINLMTFLAYMAVFINEVNGNLISATELYGNRRHPGISYLFDTVIFNQGTSNEWRKRSYNKAQPDNRSCFELFNDPEYNQVHGELPLANLLRNTRDGLWREDVYPTSTVPFTGDPSVTGYVLEADFFKFRGRGLIQTTWRTNYAKLVEEIQRYDGTGSVVSEYRDRWKDNTVDSVCTTSTNEDWRRLFEDEEKVVLVRAIRIHARDGRYLLGPEEENQTLSPSTAGLNGSGAGSLKRMGNGIGGTGYGNRLKARVKLMCDAIGRL